MTAEEIKAIIRAAKQIRLEGEEVLYLSADGDLLLGYNGAQPSGSLVVIAAGEETTWEEVEENLVLSRCQR